MHIACALCTLCIGTNVGVHPLQRTCTQAHSLRNRNRGIEGNSAGRLPNGLSPSLLCKACFVPLRIMKVNSAREHPHRGERGDNAEHLLFIQDVTTQDANARDGVKHDVYAPIALFSPASKLRPTARCYHRATSLGALFLSLPLSHSPSRSLPFLE